MKKLLLGMVLLGVSGCADGATIVPDTNSLCIHSFNQEIGRASVPEAASYIGACNAATQGVELSSMLEAVRLYYDNHGRTMEMAIRGWNKGAALIAKHKELR